MRGDGGAERVKVVPPERASGLYGILNPYGRFWSYRPFPTPEAARQYLAIFWKGYPPEHLEKFKVVPVRVTLELDFEASIPTPKDRPDERD